MNDEQRIALWREIIGSEASWVAYKNGTCVFIERPVPTDDLTATASEMLRQRGPVNEASQATPMPLSDELGWIVAFDFPDLLVQVEAEAIPADAEAGQIGEIGLRRRAADADTLEVIHIEDKRDAL